MLHGWNFNQCLHRIHSGDQGVPPTCCSIIMLKSSTDSVLNIQHLSLYLCCKCNHDVEAEKKKKNPLLFVLCGVTSGFQNSTEFKLQISGRKLYQKQPGIQWQYRYFSVFIVVNKRIQNKILRDVLVIFASDKSFTLKIFSEAPKFCCWGIQGI